MLKYYIKKSLGWRCYRRSKEHAKIQFNGPFRGSLTGIADSVIDASTNVENNLLGGWEKDSIDDVANLLQKGLQLNLGLGDI